MADLIKRKFKVFKLICILLVLNNQNASGETFATFSDRENRDRAVRLLLFPMDDKGGGTKNFLDVSDEPRSLFRRSAEDDNPTSDLEANESEKNEAKKLKRRKKKKLLRKKKKVGRRADRKKRPRQQRSRGENGANKKDPHQIDNSISPQRISTSIQIIDNQDSETSESERLRSLLGPLIDFGSLGAISPRVVSESKSHTTSSAPGDPPYDRLPDRYTEPPISYHALNTYVPPDEKASSSSQRQSSHSVGEEARKSIAAAVAAATLKAEKAAENEEEEFEYVYYDEDGNEIEVDDVDLTTTTSKASATVRNLNLVEDVEDYLFNDEDDDLAQRKRNYIDSTTTTLSSSTSENSIRDDNFKPSERLTQDSSASELPTALPLTQVTGSPYGLNPPFYQDRKQRDYIRKLEALRRQNEILLLHNAKQSKINQKKNRDDSFGVSVDFAGHWTDNPLYKYRNKAVVHTPPLVDDILSEAEDLAAATEKTLTRKEVEDHRGKRKLPLGHHKNSTTANQLNKVEHTFPKEVIPDHLLNDDHSHRPSIATPSEESSTRRGEQATSSKEAASNNGIYFKPIRPSHRDPGSYTHNPSTEHTRNYETLAVPLHSPSFNHAGLPPPPPPEPVPTYVTSTGLKPLPINDEEIKTLHSQYAAEHFSGFSKNTGIPPEKALLVFGPSGPSIPVLGTLTNDIASGVSNIFKRQNKPPYPYPKNGAPPPFGLDPNVGPPPPPNFAAAMMNFFTRGAGGRTGPPPLPGAGPAAHNVPMRERVSSFMSKVMGGHLNDGKFDLFDWIPLFAVLIASTLIMSALFPNGLNGLNGGAVNLSTSLGRKEARIDKDGRVNLDGALDHAMDQMESAVLMISALRKEDSCSAQLACRLGDMAKDKFDNKDLVLGAVNFLIPDKYSKFSRSFENVLTDEDRSSCEQKCYRCLTI